MITLSFWSAECRMIILYLILEWNDHNGGHKSICSHISLKYTDSNLHLEGERSGFIALQRKQLKLGSIKLICVRAVLCRISLLNMTVTHSSYKGLKIFVIKNKQKCECV